MNCPSRATSTKDFHPRKHHICIVVEIIYHFTSETEYRKLSAEVGKYIALDCEMVGVGGNLDIPHPSSNDERSVLARASLVNYNGIQVYDSYVKPKERVTNWRTHISGISPHHMSAARDLDTVQKDVAKLIHGRILVGHAVHHDLGVLFLSHPNHNIRDTAKHPTCPRQTPALRKLAKEILGLEIQAGQHSSVSSFIFSLCLSIILIYHKMVILRGLLFHRITSSNHIR